MTREKFEYAIKSCGYFTYFGQKYYEESELIKAFENMGLIEQEPCDDDYQTDMDEAWKQAKREPCDDNRLYIKVYADLEPQEKAEKLYQICGKEELLEVYKELGEYCEIEPCDDMTTAYLMGYYADKESMREFTEEEAKAYSKALDKMYKPTGFNVFNEPCDDVVSRQAVLDIVKDMRGLARNDVLADAIKRIEKLLPVRPKPETVTEFADRCRECGARYGKLLKAKTEYLGYWLNKEFRKEEYVLTGICSVCGRVSVIDEICHHCGARMVEPQESEDKG